VGRLFVVGTPIGNLEDITYRAVRVLGEVSLVLAEDTRHTRKLLTRYDIRARLLSYHQHNKRARLDVALAALEEGDIALVSSAGMPSISDPGFELIRAAVERGTEIHVVPGASAVVTAVVGAAIPAPAFLFIGFLPRQRGERRKRLEDVAAVRASLVVYESPHRLRSMLEDVASVLGNRSIVLARELTKIHEEYVRGSAADVIAHVIENQPRGEYTVVVGPGTEAEKDEGDAARADLIRRWASGEDRRKAVAAVVDEFGIARNDAYRMWLGVVAEGAEDGAT
jgi:16S rRNA (cytidine1402-2'-O)-methyltransferase